MTELTVILKDSERTYRQKFLCYEPYTVSETDPLIMSYVEQAKKGFNSEPEEIQIKIHLPTQIYIKTQRSKEGCQDKSSQSCGC